MFGQCTLSLYHYYISYQSLLIDFRNGQYKDYSSSYNNTVKFFMCSDNGNDVLNGRSGVNFLVQFQSYICHPDQVCLTDLHLCTLKEDLLVLKQGLKHLTSFSYKMQPGPPFFQIKTGHAAIFSNIFTQPVYCLEFLDPPPKLKVFKVTIILF